MPSPATNSLSPLATTDLNFNGANMPSNESNDPEGAYLAQALPALQALIFHAKSIFLLRLDPEFVIRYTNKAVVTFLRLEPNALLGQRLDALLTEPDAALVTSRIQEAHPSPEPMLLNLIDRDQVPLTVRCSIARLEDGHFMIIAEALVEDINTLHLELMQLNNQLSVLSRENMRKGKELTRTIRELEKANARISELAYHDALTGVANRYSLEAKLEQEIERSVRLNQPLSVIMLDLDRFKAINDQYGHAMGDKVLVALAKILSNNVRPYDLVARFGGEEFFVLLPGAVEADAAAFAERFRLAIAEMEVPDLPQRVTASFGVAMFIPGQHATVLFERADKALYRAKEAGRNCVEVDHIPEFTSWDG